MGTVLRTCARKMVQGQRNRPCNVTGKVECRSNTRGSECSRERGAPELLWVYNG